MTTGIADGVPDALWQIVQPLLPLELPKHRGAGPGFQRAQSWRASCSYCATGCRGTPFRSASASGVADLQEAF